MRSLLCTMVLLLVNSVATGEPPQVLDGTTLLETNRDIASDLVDGVDRFLLKRIDEAVAKRAKDWPLPQESRNSVHDYEQRIASLRARYAERIGLIDKRNENSQFMIEAPAVKSTDSFLMGMLSVTSQYSIAAVRWSVFEGVDGFGLLLQPKDVKFCAVLFPDAGQTPENLCGIGDASNDVALELARNGGLVIIPHVISRQREARAGRAIMTDQEFIYRSAFILGRHVLGYQVQEALAAIDIFQREQTDKPIMVCGWGEGGLLALSAGAADTRIHVTCVSGHFGPRENVWSEPIHRNVQGLLEAFGDAQLAAMIAPRELIIDPTPGPSVEIGGDGGAPGSLSGPPLEAVKKEFAIATRLLEPWKLQNKISLTTQDSSPTNRPSSSAIRESLTRINVTTPPSATIVKPITTWKHFRSAEQRRSETLGKWDRFQQRLLERVHVERDGYWSKLDTSSLPKFTESVEPYRDYFRKEIIGDWEMPSLPANPRSRMVYDKEKWLGYEVVMDLYEDVIAYGVLLVPKSETPIRNRPCVVFQHGLEGRPADTIVDDHPAYHNVSSRLAEEGYVVFAPQNLYLFKDRFRTLQRKSNPLNKTLFATIIPQHQQIVNWLKTRPEVDPNRIAFYGLSYGGKSAMRIPALVPDYCLSICSADFNDWVWKNASTSSPYSYVWTMEYEIFEFDLGPKFNYAEMAALIAPRPFMVERGHFDGVAPDERVGLEFAKVNRLYSGKLGIPERCRIEWFPGPHTIHGVGTFEFLRTHLEPR